MNVVDVAQPKQTGEQATGQHAHGQVQANGQALADNATESGTQLINFKNFTEREFNKYRAVLSLFP